MEALRLRIQELNFAAHQVVILGGKGSKDRLTVLPRNLMEPVQIHLQEVKRLHCLDLTAESIPTSPPEHHCNNRSRSD